MAKIKIPPNVREWFREQGRRGGLKAAGAGGRVAAANMTPEQRSERAKKAAAAAAKLRTAKAKVKREGKGA